jgi:sulfur-carrier protein adenylyltransferase/sulfurtransferase
MERKYTILSALLIVLALGLVVFPKKNDRKETDPGILLSSIAEKSRYLSADLVTQRIIENDPSLLLIDLRPESQYKIFTLPGAVNIQPDSLLSQSSLDLFNQPGKDKVLFSNGEFIPEKAWLLCTRYALNRVYIMKGGLNEWYNTIIKVQIPSSTASSTDLDLINFRNAARQYFTGSGIQIAAPKVTTTEKIIVTRKAPAAASGGGC